MKRLTIKMLTSVAAATLLLTQAPSAAHSQAPTPDPVVLVTGMGGPAISMEIMATRLRADGFSPSIFEMPALGFHDIVDSGRQLGDFVDNVLATTGASKVDIVAHSEGGLVARAYIKYWGGDAQVDSFVGTGVENHGTNFANLLTTFGLCLGNIACEQLSTGSQFIVDLNHPDETYGDVLHTNIATVFDEVVFPSTSPFMDTSDGTAVNLFLQSQCPLRVVEHFGLILDGAVYSGIVDGLRKEPIHLNCWAL